MLVGGDGLFGVAYAISIWRSMMHHGLLSQIDLEDHTWYAALPPVGHLTTVAAAIMFLLGLHTACGMLALATALLLLIGIRNAWDMTLWTVTRRRE